MTPNKAIIIAEANFKEEEALLIKISSISIDSTTQRIAIAKQQCILWILPIIFSTEKCLLAAEKLFVEEIQT